MDRTEFIKQNIFGRILDVGCEGGTLHKLIERDGVYGMDIRIKKYKKGVVQGDAQSIPFKDNSFDTVIAGELIEHLVNPEKFLRESNRILRKNGILIITTPNKKSWVNRLLKSSFHPTHISLFDIQSLKRITSKYFFIQRMFCLPYDKISSFGSKFKRLYWFRGLIHHFLPTNLQEEIVLLLRNRNKTFR
ncbi:MAG: class I SAM-dependent methyltransferase [Candidatus Aenigmarchaeota archaeon]|nr:class I SAM-dependent methyltransferase [Candidatus Aenigmarchaeota archaeon]